MAESMRVKSLLAEIRQARKVMVTVTDAKARGVAQVKLSTLVEKLNQLVLKGA